MKKLKVVTIGGGSSYTPELVEGFIKRYDELPISELWLVDIEAGKEKLEIVGNLAKRMVEKAQVPMKIHLTLDREEALKDADFVTTQMRVGGLQARILDERIPIKHGIIGQETNGAGGMFKAFRTIPVILQLVADMERLCPQAWLINFTNPAGIITEAILNYTNFKNVIGLCNVPITMVNAFAKMLHVPASEVTLRIAGLNHHFFVTDVLVSGVSRFDEVMDVYLEADDAQATSMKNIMAIPWSSALLKGLNAIPCSYLNYFYHTREQLHKQLELYELGEVRAQAVA
ncbi:MAG: 6-phospho-beta-glucosidase, partial [Erysipelotrichaceae bacterium]